MGKLQQLSQPQIALGLQQLINQVDDPRQLVYFIATNIRMEIPDAQAILVFLAGRTWRAPELGGDDGLSALSLQRLHHAVYLHRRTGLPLAVSGGATRAGRDEGLAAVVVAVAALSIYLLKRRVL